MEALELRLWLQVNNIRVKDFAKEVGVSPNTVSNWITGKVKIRPWVSQYITTRGGLNNSHKE